MMINQTEHRLLIKPWWWWGWGGVVAVGVVLGGEMRRRAPVGVMERQLEETNAVGIQLVIEISTSN